MRFWVLPELTVNQAFNERQLRTTCFRFCRFYSVLSAENETVPMCGFYEVPARTASSSSGLRRREMCCMRKYTSAYVHASKFRLSGCLFVCMRACMCVCVYVYMHW